MLKTQMIGPGGSTIPLLGMVKSGILVGLYDIEDYPGGGALFKRVCDHPVGELLRHEALPRDWPKKYEPVNRYGGSRKMPSRHSAADLMAAT